MRAERAATRTALPVHLNIKARTPCRSPHCTFYSVEKSAHGTIALSNVIYLMNLIAYCATRAVTLTRRFEYVRRENADAAYLTAATVNIEHYVMYGKYFE